MVKPPNIIHRRLIIFSPISEDVSRICTARPTGHVRVNGILRMSVVFEWMSAP